MTSVGVIVSTYIFLGHLGDIKFYAGSCLGMFFHSTIIQTVVFGMNQTLNTYVSQAYGAKNIRMVGVYFNKGLIICCFMLPMMVALIMNADSILKMLG